MKLVWKLALLGLFAAPVALAQQDDGAPKRERAKRPARQSPYDATMSGRDLVKRLTNDLELNDDQRAKLNAALQQTNKQVAHDAKPDAGRLLAELRKAGGDEHELAAIKGRLHPVMEQQTLALLSEVPPILTDEQARKFERLVAPMRVRTPRWKGSLMESLAFMRHALKLDAQHAEGFDQAVKALRADLFASHTTIKDMDKDELLAKVQEALASKDPDAIRNIRSQLKTDAPDVDLAVVRFVNELAGQIGDQRRPVLEEFVERVMSTPNKPGAPRDPRHLVQVARQNSLDHEQRDAMREIERDFNEAPHGDNEARFVALYQCTSRIAEVLTQPQLNAFRKIVDADLKVPTAQEPDAAATPEGEVKGKKGKPAGEGKQKKKKKESAGEDPPGDEP